MKTLWKQINECKLNQSQKYRVFLILWTIINALAGAILWLILGRFFLSGVEGIICFMGCPALLIGFYGGILYLYRHEFL